MPAYLKVVAHVLRSSVPIALSLCTFMVTPGSHYSSLWVLDGMAFSLLVNVLLVFHAFFRISLFFFSILFNFCYGPLNSESASTSVQVFLEKKKIKLALSEHCVASSRSFFFFSISQLPPKKQQRRKRTTYRKTHFSIKYNAQLYFFFFPIFSLFFFSFPFEARTHARSYAVDERLRLRPRWLPT